MLPTTKHTNKQTWAAPPAEALITPNNNSTLITPYRLYTNVYIIYVYMYMHIHIYIYIERERDTSLSLSLSLYIYIYI